MNQPPLFTDVEGMGLVNREIEHLLGVLSNSFPLVSFSPYRAVHPRSMSNTAPVMPQAAGLAT